MLTLSHDFRTHLVGYYHGLEAELKEGEDIVCTFFLPHGPIKLFLGRVISSDDGMFQVNGVKEDGHQAVLLFNVRDAYFFLEVIDSGEPRKIGFALT